ncbi:MAG: DMT family transporter [Sediminibacterium sp.]
MKLILLVDARKNKYIGILLATIAAVIWAGNFVIARGVNQQIAPITLAFFRWSLATILMLPIALKKFRSEIHILKKHKSYLFWVALTGITLFNTCLYISGHYTTAINMALISTTSSPIFATTLAILFIGERINKYRFMGMIVCLSGVLLLISKGSLQTLLSFTFSLGDLWALAGAFSFSVYNVLVRKKPATISATTFLLAIFGLGTMLILPGFLLEQTSAAPIVWNKALVMSLIYLGAGTSVISFLCWNAAIKRIGAGTTVLFGNLIPIISTIEAVVFLNEPFQQIHMISAGIVIAGLILANTRQHHHQHV